MSTERPLLFHPPLVKSILIGQKDVTRRNRGLEEINKKPERWEFLGESHEGIKYSVQMRNKKSGLTLTIECPYGRRADIIWVREKFSPLTQGYAYAADFSGTKLPTFGLKWKPSIHMPRKACRLFLKIKNIVLVPLQYITEQSAKNEGIEQYLEVPTGIVRYKDYMADASGYGDASVDYPTVSTAKESFFSLWEKINGKKSLEKNPWVWAIRFEIDKAINNPWAKN